MRRASYLQTSTASLLSVCLLFPQGVVRPTYPPTCLSRISTSIDHSFLIATAPLARLVPHLVRGKSDETFPSCPVRSLRATSSRPLSRRERVMLRRVADTMRLDVTLR